MISENDLGGIDKILNTAVKEMLTKYEGDKIGRNM